MTDRIAEVQKSGLIRSTVEDYIPRQPETHSNGPNAGKYAIIARRCRRSPPLVIHIIYGDVSTDMSLPMGCVFRSTRDWQETQRGHSSQFLRTSVYDHKKAQVGALLGA